MKLGEVVGGIGAGGVLLEERVEVAHHLADSGQVLRRDPLDALLEALEVGLQHLLSQLVGQLAERLTRDVVHELVVAQPMEAAGQVRRQRVQPVLTLARRAPHHLLGHARRVLVGARWRVEGALLGGLHALGDALPLGLQDLLEPLVDVVEHAVQVRALQLGLALGTEPFHDLAQARDVAATGAAQAPLHQPLERPADVALGQDVVGQGVEHVVRIEGRQLLAAVPSRVAEGAHGRLSLGRCRGSVHGGSIHDSRPPGTNQGRLTRTQMHASRRLPITDQVGNQIHPESTASRFELA